IIFGSLNHKRFRRGLAVMINSADREAVLDTCQSAPDIDPLSACKVDPLDMGFGLSR
ncbi:MAG: hypothetical protein RLZZ444_1832, partial [Pseudomonadota bacterium]